MSTGMFPVGGKHPRQLAAKYRSAIKGWGRPDHHIQSVHQGPYIAVHSEAPPEVAAYDEWLAAHRNPRPGRGAKPAWTGGKLRRAVVMRRNGCGFKEIGLSVGLSGSTVKAGLAELPPELRP